MEQIGNEYGIMVDNQFIGVRYYDVEDSLEKKLLKTFIIIFVNIINFYT